LWMNTHGNSWRNLRFITMQRCDCWRTCIAREHRTRGKTDSQVDSPSINSRSPS
jgi:hypothetical protein